MQTKVINRTNGDKVVRVWEGEWGSANCVWMQMVLTEWEAEHPGIMDMTIKRLTLEVEKKIKENSFGE